MIVDDVRNKVKEVLDAKAKELLAEDAKAIRKLVDDLLKDNTTNWVKKFLGFENRWSFHDGNWEVDHCNGRSGDSFVANEIRDLVAEATSNWIKNYFNVPKMDKKLLLALQKEYEQERSQVLKEKIRKLAQEDVRDNFQSILEEIKNAKPDEDYEQYLRLKKKFEGQDQ